MSDFLLELRSEEIPARMQAGARADLEKLFRKAMADAGVTLGAVTVWSTPRRLALIARDLPSATAAVSEEVKGPRVGAPPQALEGFLRKTGLTEDQLVERDGVLFAVSEKPGRATAEVLAEAIPALVRAFPWPKSQRWGAASISTESLRWVRPLSAIVALFDGTVVDCEVGGIAAGRLTRGHRFHSDGDIAIDGVDDYAAKLRAAHVIVDHAERQDLIRTAAKAAAAAEGLTLVEDEGLVIENAGLTEWPVPLLGRFDEAYLEVPPEVIQLTARTNQKYFVCEAEGKLANAFVCTANIAAADGGTAIVAGNRKVLAARLSDASFFWQQDRKVSLEDQAKKLERITFHEKLGTVADKVERVAKLARWLVEEGIVTASSPNRGGGPAQLVEGQVPTREALADMAEQAARLCKADLVTEMVGEFPELQGLMGGYYARAEGLPDAVADAIRDHYKPVGQGDDVPTAPVTVAVALADKLDTLAGFFLIDQRPSGSKDPFALRRAILSVEALIITNLISVSLSRLLLPAIKFHAWWAYIQCMDNSLFKSFTKMELWLEIVKHYPGVEIVFEDSKNFKVKSNGELMLASGSAKTGLAPQILGEVDCERALVTFAVDRLKVQQKEAGVRHDLIDAVFALGGEDDLVRLLARVHALQAFVGSEDGTNLLAGYKRAANILKKEEFAAGVVNPAPEPAEAALIAALDAAAPLADAAIAAEDFTAAMAALASLRAPIDSFFESVTVNADDPAVRAARLGLLSSFRAAVHKVADFSRIEG
ncbi:glycine--tRNA ligase subunit beta [Novosphingobium sp.]|uniref:glycine--tRNA ligase subunit beta n=1 Tax=Novosphingobium sp. TaxID=1874826 RepID=UPI0027338F1E|nr:glycine--tRNA ligase subunit beta [Novosphingobium sp.]MDP3905930.1 glycine--tRNA ligase subunit beta [Novosphingobium sp.]